MALFSQMLCGQLIAASRINLMYRRNIVKKIKRDEGDIQKEQTTALCH